MSIQRGPRLVLLSLPWLALIGRLGPLAADPPGSSPSIVPPALGVDLSRPPLLPPLLGIGSENDWSPTGERQPATISRQNDVGWGSLSGQVEINDGRPSWDDPIWKRAWKANQSWRGPVLGPLTVFSQMGANSDEAGQQNMQVTGRTGLSCRIPLGLLGEYTFTGGPGVSYADPLRPTQTREQTDWQLQVQARLPLLHGIGLEYDGTANPSPMTPLDQSTINQDVRLAFPVGGGGKLKVGARHRWAGLYDPRPWTDSMQLYMGLELSH
jgi:hypothetical protein